MQTISVEAALGQTLSGLSGQAVFCDPEGRVLGFFSPLPNRPRLEDLQLEPPHTIAETEELRKSKTGKPLEEILARLGLQ